MKFCSALYTKYQCYLSKQKKLKEQVAIKLAEEAKERKDDGIQQLEREEKFYTRVLKWQKHA